ncbi:MAG: response regulator [Phycisphaerae bacterium]|nr:response regulator [Saprospiraceae bacterium]
MPHQRAMILLADDDADDRYLVKTAFEENAIPCELRFVEDGTEVFDFLMGQGKFAEENNRLPNLILLDLNMPKKNGKQVLQEIKALPDYDHIPVVIFTTSKSPDDVRLLYKMGASSFISKPSTFDKLSEIVRNIGCYWMDTATIS